MNVSPKTAGIFTSAETTMLMQAEREAEQYEETSPGRLRWMQFLVLGAFLIALYGKICIKLVHDWYTLPDFSHGFLVPVFAAWILWNRRKELAAVPQQPSWTGIFISGFALVVLMMGIYGAELFLARLSLLILLAGMVWTLMGPLMVRKLTFVFFVLLMAIPIPAVVFNQITFPLQLLASRCAADVLPLFGVPVLREGNIIQLASMQLEVAEACSGIRSLLSLFTVALIYGYFLEKSPRTRVLLALAAVPIAVVANVVRIVGTGLCVQYWNPDKAVGFFHEFSGWLMFLVSLGCLYLVHKALTWKQPRKARTA